MFTSLFSLTISLYTPWGVYYVIYPSLRRKYWRVWFQYSIDYEWYNELYKKTPGKLQESNIEVLENTRNVLSK